MIRGRSSILNRVHRFYVPAVRLPGDHIDLPYEEAQHALRVLRLTPGARVRLFDGRGHEFDAEIVRATKAAVTVRVDARCAAPATEPRVAITLAMAVLKGDKMDGVVRDAVMIGASTIVPIVTARTEVSLTAVTRGQRRDRWERIAVSSAKQCGRAVVPTISPPIDFATLVAALEQRSMPMPSLMCVEPSTGDTLPRVSELEPGPPREVTLIVGPEGGWTPQERARVGGLCQLVRLGARTLRAEAAPLVAVAALLTLWHEL
jgi:16S rRNA (uracil1498-N3)-methyltransferase